MLFLYPLPAVFCEFCTLLAFILILMFRLNQITKSNKSKKICQAKPLNIYWYGPSSFNFKGLAQNVGLARVEFQLTRQKGIPRQIGSKIGSYKWTFQKSNLFSPLIIAAPLIVLSPQDLTSFIKPFYIIGLNFKKLKNKKNYN